MYSLECIEFALDLVVFVIVFYPLFVVSCIRSCSSGWLGICCSTFLSSAPVGMERSYSGTLVCIQIWMLMLIMDKGNLIMISIEVSNLSVFVELGLSYWIWHSQLVQLDMCSGFMGLDDLSVVDLGLRIFTQEYEFIGV